MYAVQVPRRFTQTDWGGTETAILASSRELAARGHRVEVFTSMALAPRSRDALAGIEIRRFRHLYPYAGLTEAEVDAMDRKGGNLVSAGLMRALLAEPGIDLLHAHTAKRLGGMVRTAARLRGIPYVVSLHGGWFDLPPQSRSDLARPYQGRLEWGKALGWLLGSRRVLSDAAAVLCVGQSELRLARQALPDVRVELMPNGVDTARFAAGDALRFRHRHGIPPGRKILLNVGRIDPQKNQLALLEAMALLLPDLPELHLVLIGGITDPAYYERLLARIRDLSLQDRVTVIPGLAPDDPSLVDAYHAASVFCLPSVHEPFGIVVLEAWAAGLPTVVARVGGLAGLTTEGRDALQVDPERPEQLARALFTVLQSPELSRRLSTNGRATATGTYDWRVIGLRLERLYAEVTRH